MSDIDITERLRHPDLCKMGTSIEYQHEVLGRAADEIERLRARVRTLESMGTSESKRLLGLLAKERRRIEELEDDLRKEWLIGYAEAKDEDIGIFHIITTDQIRAARDQTHNPASNGIYARGAENALKELGIVRCEECRGAGDVGLNDCAVGCPDCGGEGWRIE